MYSIIFELKVQKTMAKWKKSNPNLFKKLRKVLEDMMAHPRNGIGHPEPLVGGSDITYSRRITKKDRIIYDIYDECIEVLVLELESHYDDK